MAELCEEIREDSNEAARVVALHGVTGVLDRGPASIGEGRGEARSVAFAECVALGVPDDEHRTGDGLNDIAQRVEVSSHAGEVLGCESSAVVLPRPLSVGQPAEVVPEAVAEKAWISTWIECSRAPTEPVTARLPKTAGEGCP